MNGILPRSLSAYATARSGVSRVLIALFSLPIHVYRYVISPLTGRSCRYSPSCSAYALEALQQHGAFRGSLLTLRRIARCHPWGGSGYDPVPKKETQL